MIKIFSTEKLRTLRLFTSRQPCMWISCWIRVYRAQVRPVQTSGSLTGPDPESGLAGTYVAAPYGRMLCAMLASLALPTCEWPDASQPNPLHLMGPSGSGCHGDGWLVAAAWRRQGRRVGGGDGSLVRESNKSDRSQRSPSELAGNLAFDV
ncbi:hypothetical protein VZT92_025485 [Zoarces viviparus]|uniref:Uncharacterized protein n=1 Tax=Zoarces viviparus TaxID=48416 RepID=A0AAW1DYJ3_ZOAVI